MPYIDLERGAQPDSPLRLCWSGKARTFVSSSVQSRSRLILADWGGNIWAVDSETGKQMWQTRSAGAIVEPLFLFSDGVWALDDKGQLNAYDVETGERLAHYQLPFGGWGLQHHENHSYFVNRINARRFTANGHPARLNLLTGELEVLTERLAGDPEGSKNLTRIMPKQDAVLFFAAPDLLQFSLTTGKLQRSWHIPDSYTLAGLAVFDHTIITITELLNSRGSAIGAARYLEHNPTPLLLIAADTRNRMTGYPLLARGVFKYHASSYVLPERIFFVELAETLFHITDCQVIRAAPLPKRSVWGNRSAGLFQVEEQFLVFQQHQALPNTDSGDYLQLYSCAPDTLEAHPLGLPLRTNPKGKNHQVPEVDPYESHFLVRADGRYHYLRWRDTTP